MHTAPTSLQPGSGGLLVLWDWEYDGQFVAKLRAACLAAGVPFAECTGDALKEFASKPVPEEDRPRVALDRASDSVPGIALRLMELKATGTRLVNDPQQMAWCRDKATMHLELLSAGVRVPYGVVLSTEDHPSSMDILELAAPALGSPFVIKPAEGGGGEGVVLDARTKRDVSDYFKRMGRGKIVIQHQVLPRMLGSRRGWFRVFWVLGQIIPCWWDDLTHIYAPLDAADEAVFELRALHTITTIIARVSRMDLFTTEIAVDKDGQLVAVDFVNEMPDLRLQSEHPDGVPDAVVDRVARTLAGLAAASSNAGAGNGPT